MFNWVKTAMLMAAIMALFGIVGGMIGGRGGMLRPYMRFPHASIANLSFAVAGARSSNGFTAPMKRCENAVEEGDMARKWTAETTRTVDLGYEQMLMLEGRPGTRVKVLYGGVWLTEEGWPDDIFAFTGEAVALRSRQRSLIESLGPTRVEIVQPLCGRAVAAPGHWGARVAQRLTSMVKLLASPRIARGTLGLAGALVGLAVPGLVLIGMSGPGTLALLAG